jgi:hypothetical protein
MTEDAFGLMRPDLVDENFESWLKATKGVM